MPGPSCAGPRGCRGEALPRPLAPTPRQCLKSALMKKRAAEFERENILGLQKFPMYEICSTCSGSPSPFPCILELSRPTAGRARDATFASLHRPIGAATGARPHYYCGHLGSGRLSDRVRALRLLPSSSRNGVFTHDLCGGSPLGCGDQRRRPPPAHATLGRGERFRRVSQ